MTTVELRHIPRVSEQQIEFARKLGLDLRGCTVGVAAAQIQVQVREGFWGESDSRCPTEKQLAFAKKYGVDLRGLDREVADALVDDLMTELNMEAIEAESLAPGARVVNVHDSLGRVEVISSITADGTVYLKGGQGKRAWARSLRQASKGRVPDASSLSSERRRPEVTQSTDEQPDG